MLGALFLCCALAASAPPSLAAEQAEVAAAALSRMKAGLVDATRSEYENRLNIVAAAEAARSMVCDTDQLHSYYEHAHTELSDAVMEALFSSREGFVPLRCDSVTAALVSSASYKTGLVVRRILDAALRTAG